MFSISNVIFSSGFQNQLQYGISFKKVTIFVGPNNSGKSTILKDIEKWFNEKYPKMSLVNDIEISLSTNPDDYTEFEKDILQFEDGQRLGPEGELIPLIKQHLLTEIQDGPGIV